MNRITAPFMLVLMLVLTASAQQKRTITPVEPEPERPEVVRNRPTSIPSNVIRTEDAEGNTVLVDTITGLEVPDTTVAKVPKMIYPLIYRLDVGVNAWDGMMRCLGQKYGLGGVFARLNMHNRYFGYIEGGLGAADMHPDGSNYRYKSPVAPYFKIGAEYNMFFNSNPAYRLLAGVHYGFSPFSFRIADATLSDGYWDESTTFGIPSQHTTAGYIEIALGVHVTLVRNLWVGWSVMYHSILHESKCPLGKPIYIPGYGKRSNSFYASLHIGWTFDLNKRASDNVKTEKTKD